MANQTSAAPDPSVISDFLKRLRDIEEMTRSDSGADPDEFKRIAAVRDKLRQITSAGAKEQRSPEARKQDRDSLKEEMQAALQKLDRLSKKLGG